MTSTQRIVEGDVLEYRDGKFLLVRDGATTVDEPHIPGHTAILFLTLPGLAGLDSFLTGRTAIFSRGFFNLIDEKGPFHFAAVWLADGTRFTIV